MSFSGLRARGAEWAARRHPADLIRLLLVVVAVVAVAILVSRGA